MKFNKNVTMNISDNEIDEIKKIKPELISGKIKDVVTKTNIFSFWNKKNTVSKNIKLTDKIKLKKNPEESYLINMLFRNGTSMEWVITTSERTFNYKKKMYFIKYEESFFDISASQYKLYYIENCSTPINREIHYAGDSAFFKVTPENLKDFIAMRYIKKLTESDDDKFKWIYIILIGIGALLIMLLMKKNGGG